MATQAFPVASISYQTTNLSTWETWRWYPTQTSFLGFNYQQVVYPTTSIFTSDVWVTAVTAPVRLTPEELAAIGKREADARKKACALLMSLLCARQRRRLSRSGFFELQIGVRLYRIRPGCRVERFDAATRKLASLYCIHPRDRLVAEDEAIAQKLLLEGNEALFLATANEMRAA